MNDADDQPRIIARTRARARDAGHPGMDGVAEYEDRLRRLAINDMRTLVDTVGDRLPGTTAGRLDERTASLIRIGVLVALDGPDSSFGHAIECALATGATADQIVEVLAAIGPMVGSTHVVAAAPRIAHALGYDIEAALERCDWTSGIGRGG